MMDPMQSRLAKVRYEEQLREAAEATIRRATWVAEPGLIERLHSALTAFVRTFLIQAQPPRVRKAAIRESDG